MTQAQGRGRPGRVRGSARTVSVLVLRRGNPMIPRPEWMESIRGVGQPGVRTVFGAMRSHRWRTAVSTSRERRDAKIQKPNRTCSIEVQPRVGQRARRVSSTAVLRGGGSESVDSLIDVLGGGSTFRRNTGLTRWEFAPGEGEPADLGLPGGSGPGIACDLGKRVDTLAHSHADSRRSWRGARLRPSSVPRFGRPPSGTTLETSRGPSMVSGLFAHGSLRQLFTAASSRQGARFNL